MMSQSLETLKRIASKKSVALKSGIDSLLVKNSTDYLQSDTAFTSMKIDPYWPKWDSPWWHMLLLHELGLADAIPDIAIERMCAALNSHYLPVFPVLEEELPVGVDPLGQIACHCQLGEIEQVLASCGVNVVEKIPYLRSWYFRYQLPDGGLNCDESAYIKDKPASSIVSTLPPLEAVLSARGASMTIKEREFLARGANYLISKRLLRSAKSNAVLNDSWTKLSFPRFFEYDILRGLNFLLSWSVATKSALPVESIFETVTTIDDQFADGYVINQRSIWAATNTRFLNLDSSTWSKRLAASFPLLESVSVVDAPSSFLTACWNEAKQTLCQALEEDMVSA